MKLYGVWILPSTAPVKSSRTGETKDMEFPGHWLHDKDRIVFSTPSKGLAEAQASVAIFEPSEARAFDE